MTVIALSYTDWLEENYANCSTQFLENIVRVQTKNENYLACINPANELMRRRGRMPISPQFFDMMYVATYDADPLHEFCDCGEQAVHTWDPFCSMECHDRAH